MWKIFSITAHHKHVCLFMTVLSRKLFCSPSGYLDYCSFFHSVQSPQMVIKVLWPTSQNKSIHHLNVAYCYIYPTQMNINLCLSDWWMPSVWAKVSSLMENITYEVISRGNGVMRKCCWSTLHSPVYRLFRRIYILKNLHITLPVVLLAS